MEKDEQNGMDAQVVAKQMVNQVMSNRMKVTVVPGFQYKVICWLFNRIPAATRLWVVGLLYGWKYLLISYFKKAENSFFAFLHLYFNLPGQYQNSVS